MIVENVVASYLGVAGLLASHAGDKENSEVIAAGLDATGCEVPSIQMAIASIDLGNGHHDRAAARIREKVLASDPENARAKIMLGMVEHDRGHTAQRDKLWNEAVDSGLDEQLVELIEKERAGV